MNNCADRYAMPTRCSHGIGWVDTCLECELIWQRDRLKHATRTVEDANRRIADFEARIADARRTPTA